MAALFRLAVLLLILVVSIFLVAAHGLRGFFIVIALLLAWALPQTRAWQVIDHALVRLTGSRRRAAALIMGVIIGTLLVVNLYQLVR
jgi:hypothetical protein